MRFEKSTQIEEDFHSTILEQDVAVEGSVTVKGYHNKATYDDPEDWDFNITDWSIEFFLYDENENKIKSGEELDKILKDEFIDWMYDHSERFID